MALSGRTDGELLDAWRDGDERAGNALFERYFDVMYRFFRSKLESGVEDLIQQTFLACVRSRDQFRGDASFRTYLYRVAKSKLYDALRARHRGAGDVSLVTLADLRTSPSTWVARNEEHQLLQLAMAQLPLDLHVAIELFYFEDLPASTVAAVLDVPEGTVRSRVRRAIAQLRDEIERVAAPANVTDAALDGVDTLVHSKP